MEWLYSSYVKKNKNIIGTVQSELPVICLFGERKFKAAAFDFQDNVVENRSVGAKQRGCVTANQNKLLHFTPFFQMGNNSNTYQGS